MEIFVANYNQLITNKMQWMARELRYYNDPGSIMNWTYAMASLKNLLLSVPGNSAGPLPIHLAQPIPKLSLSEAKHISCNAQPFYPAPGNHPAFKHDSAKCKPMEEYSMTKTTSLSTPPCKVICPTATPIYPKADISVSNCLPRKETQSYGEKSSSSPLRIAKKASEPLKIPTRKRLKQTPKPIHNKTKPSHGLQHSTCDGVNPHALPTDFEFQNELALLKRDAAAAKMKLTDYITANRTKYQRVTRYLWCLSDDVIF